MLLWIGFAVMTAAVIAALVRPLGRQRAVPLDSRAADLAVYKDQLAEIDKERASGLLGEAEAEAARTEVARRMLARADRTESVETVEANPAVDGGSIAAKRRFGISAPQAILAAIPVLAAVVYIVYGSPWLPDQPYAGRISSSRSQITDLVAKVEKRLRENPDDGQGWDVLAPVYRRFERYGDAAQAYRNAIRLLGADPKRLWGLAESVIASNNGLVTAEARDALEKVVPLDQSNIGARFWLAAAKEQDGRRADAVTDYKSLLADVPPDTAWRKAVEDRLTALGAEVPAAAADASSQGPQALRGPRLAGTSNDKAPSAAEMAAAEQMSPAERAAMVEKMVSGLAERLKADGRDLEGWQKLVRAYKVMGREPDARRALASARGVFKGDAKAEAELDALAASLGLGS